MGNFYQLQNKKLLSLAVLLTLTAAATLALPFSAAYAQSPAANTNDAVNRAKTLIEKKNPDAAYKLLQPLENTHAGEEDFDYWFGVAAFESNRLERAAMAFERALISNPEFDSARLELGRTYLRMGSLDLADQEFKRLLTRAPSPQGKTLLEGYIAEIARTKAKQRFSVSTYIEAGGGRDNNLSSSTRDFPGAILNSFGLAGIQPTGNSIRRGDNYASTNLGLGLTNRYRENRSIFFAANARARFFGDYGDFNYTLLDAVGGHEWRMGERSFGLSAFAQKFSQDGAFDPAAAAARVTNNRTILGISSELRSPISATATLGLGLQAGTIRYQTNKTQDTDQLTFSTSVQNLPKWMNGGNVSGMVFFTKERAKRTLNEFIDTSVSRKSYGARFSLASDPRESVSWSGSVSWTRRADDKPFARAGLVEFGVDNLYDVTVRLSWRMNDKWSVLPYLSYTDNRSNISLYSFRKADGGFVIRRDFK